MSLQETFADVAALIPRYSWEIMDEEQRDDLMGRVVLPRYMETTADGVQLGPTAWGEMVGATAHAIRGRVQRLQASQNSGDGERARTESQKSSVRHARTVLRNAPPEEIAELLDTPEIRTKVNRALDTHYTDQARKTTARVRAKDVERKGGEDEHAAYEERQRVAELVSVVRGAASALRFAAGQARALRLDEDDSGGADELRASLEEILGFAEMLREFLAGREITDEDIVALIGDR